VPAVFIVTKYGARLESGAMASRSSLGAAVHPAAPSSAAAPCSVPAAAYQF